MNIRLFSLKLPSLVKICPTIIEILIFSALTLLVGWHEGHPAHKKYGEW